MQNTAYGQMAPVQEAHSPEGHGSTQRPNSRQQPIVLSSNLSPWGITLNKNTLWSSHTMPGVRRALRLSCCAEQLSVF